MSNSPAAATRPARSGGFTSRKLAPYLFLAPFVLLFIAFIVAPLVYAFYMSLYRDTLVGGRQFSGAASYIKVTGDTKFWGGVWNLVLFGIVQVPIMLSLGLLSPSCSIVARSMPRASSGWASSSPTPCQA